MTVAITDSSSVIPWRISDNQTAKKQFMLSYATTNKNTSIYYINRNLCNIFFPKLA